MARPPPTASTQTATIYYSRGRLDGRNCFNATSGPSSTCVIDGLTYTLATSNNSRYTIRGNGGQMVSANWCGATCNIAGLGTGSYQGSTYSYTLKTGTTSTTTSVRSTYTGKQITSSGNDYRYYDSNIRNAGEHANGCLYGHFFVILARGASADPTSTLYSKFRSQGTSGIGVMKAARIWYRATTAYLSPNPTYLDVRKAYMDAAAALYGKNSPEYTGVLEAWAAIGLSSQPKDKLTIQF